MLFIPFVEPVYSSIYSFGIAEAANLDCVFARADARAFTAPVMHSFCIISTLLRSAAGWKFEKRVAAWSTGGRNQAI